MRRSATLTPRLRSIMTDHEYGTLLREMSEANAEAVKFRYFHALLWIPMIAFWAIGGFCIMIWGIKTMECLGRAAAGDVAAKFFARKPNVSWALVPGTMGGKHHAGTQGALRVFLPAPY